MIKRNFIKKSLRLRFQSVHQILERVQFRNNIVDIGCGNGKIISSIALKYQISAVGLDISPSVIAWCLSVYSIPNLIFKEGDIHNLPFNEGLLDVVLSISLVEWIEDYEKAVAEISRVLRVGGSWIVSIPNWQSPFRKLQRILSHFRSKSYLHYQKNHLGISKFIKIAKYYGFNENQIGYQVLPFFPINLKNKFLKRFGMNCMIVLTKTM